MGIGSEAALVFYRDSIPLFVDGLWFSCVIFLFSLLLLEGDIAIIVYLSLYPSNPLMQPAYVVSFFICAYR